MSRNVSDAARGAADIADNISGVASDAHTTTTSLAETIEAVDELAHVATDLQAAIGRFRV